MTLDLINPYAKEAPALPTGLKVIATQKIMYLYWNANKEADLAGYYVYRMVKGDPETMTKLATNPVTVPQYQDTTAQSGVTYVYSLTAVDTKGFEGGSTDVVEATLLSAQKLRCSAMCRPRPGSNLLSISFHHLVFLEGTQVVNSYQTTILPEQSCEGDMLGVRLETGPKSSEGF